MSTRRWVEWVNVLLGVWLIASPWLLTLQAGDKLGAWSSLSTGIAVVALAAVSLHRPSIWGSAFGIVLGAWLIASPWLLHLTSSSSAAVNAIIVGVLVVGYALWAMRIDFTREAATRTA